MQGIGLTISDDSNQDNNNGGSRYSFNYQVCTRKFCKRELAIDNERF